MNNRVCMFVWNHFTNDARVLRECTALSERGYKVDLICIHDPRDGKLPKYEKKNEDFQVFRVRRYPFLLEKLQSYYTFFHSNRSAGFLALIGWLILFYLMPVFTAIISFLLYFLVKTKAAKTLWVRSAIFFRMIAKGRSRDYGIYHSNDLNTLPQGWICSKLRLKKRKLIYDSHEVQTSRTGYDHFFYKTLESFFIYKADEMIVENHTRARYNKKVYGFYPHIVHNYPFPLKENNTPPVCLHETLNIPPNEKILLYQGGIQTGRGLDKLIEAVPLFKSGVLVLIGDGKIKADLEDEVRKENLSDRVKFLPKVPLEELPDYTRQAYLGFQVLNNVCFNHYSASSNKLFEYMMSGVPVIACRFPEIKRVVERERTGICVDSHQPEAIADAVNQLLSDQAARDEYAKNAVNASRKYNWTVEKENFLSVYERVREEEEELGWRKISIK